jgi:hypothetical protein
MATSKFTDWALVLKTNRLNDLIVFKGSKWRNVHLESYAPVLLPQRPVEMKSCGDDPIIIKEDIGCNGRQQQASKEKLWAFLQESSAFDLGMSVGDGRCSEC